MQALWSRAGQVRLCGCKGCLPAASGMIRQSTTRVPRRKPTFGEFFTAFYTSIMGTAAMYDARRKDARRKELDRQLAEVRSDLERLLEPIPASDLESEPAPPSDIFDRSDGMWYDYKKQRGFSQYLDGLGDTSTWLRNGPRSAELERWLRTSGLPELEPSATAASAPDYEQLQQRLQQEEENPNIAHRVPKTRKQLIAAQNAVRSLVVELLRAADLGNLTRHGRLDRSAETASETELRTMLKQKSYPLFETLGHDMVKGTIELNRSLRAILASSQAALRRDATHDIRDSVTKVCYNLLVSPHPPTIHTISILILGFDQMGKHAISNAAVRHFLYASRTAPTEQAMVCMLNHYKEQGNLVRFHKLVDRFTGRDPRGIHRDQPDHHAERPIHSRTRLANSDADKMQALWSRAGQVRLCGCKGCLPAASGMIRQSTTRVPRRKPTFGEFFTAFYTSIMGTAAMYDARRKDARRKELDRQLAEVRSDLERLLEPIPASDLESEPAPPSDIFDRSDGMWYDYKKQRGFSQYLDGLGDTSTWLRNGPRSAELERWLRTSGLPELEPSATAASAPDYEQLQQRLQQEEENPNIAHRVPKTRKQLIAAQNAVRSLVVELLRAADLGNLTRHGRLDRSAETASETELRTMLKQKSYPLFETLGHDMVKGTIELNRSLRAILASSQAALRRDATHDIRDSVTKVCYNLLVSPHPPTIHTISILILGFDQMGKHAISNAAVRHFLYASRTAPTEQAMVCMLNHYKEQGNLVRFHKLVDRFTGRDPRGIHCCRHLTNAHMRWTRM
ncbi:hypothetical protein HYQ45_012505 [Verticillium longisporum]|uniref:Uncharacterized protein n=1 Tax=Verticillium longisporum TaxID=100787 RepID=A0A8I2ZE86_VERLO|nr:hypothetical protein HYQ45_012505 [Verticillium longisporum]